MWRILNMLLVIFFITIGNIQAQEAEENEVEEIEESEASESQGSRTQILVDMEGNIFFDAPNRTGIFGGERSEAGVTDFSSDHGYTMRFRAGARIACKHDAFFVYAPLQQVYTGRFTQEMPFNGTTFNEFQPTNAVYTLNSYRLTYRYFFLWRSNFRMAAGLTGMYNDGSILINQGEQLDVKSEDDFVPAAHLYAELKLAPRTSILFEGDGQVAGPGMFIDYQVAIPYQLTDNLTVRAGYRMTDGGNRVDPRFNFSRFHYGLAGLGLNF